METSLQSTAPATETYDLTRFGDRLRWCLARKKFNQTEFAVMLGLAKASISQFCLSTKPTGGGKKVVQMADILDVPVTWLQFGIPAGEPPVAESPAPALQPYPSSTPNLSALQSATLQNLAKVMSAGEFDDVACLALLHQLTPALTKLSASETVPQ